MHIIIMLFSPNGTGVEAITEATGCIGAPENHKTTHVLL